MEGEEGNEWSYYYVMILLMDNTPFEEKESLIKGVAWRERRERGGGRGWASLLNLTDECELT